MLTVAFRRNCEGCANCRGEDFATHCAVIARGSVEAQQQKGVHLTLDVPAQFFFYQGTFPRRRMPKAVRDSVVGAVFKT